MGVVTELDPQYLPSLPANVVLLNNGLSQIALQFPQNNVLRFAGNQAVLTGYFSETNPAKQGVFAPPQTGWSAPGIASVGLPHQAPPPVITPEPGYGWLFVLLVGSAAFLKVIRGGFIW